jgi:hypothetical protein
LEDLLMNWLFASIAIVLPDSSAGLGVPEGYTPFGGGGNTQLHPIVVAAVVIGAILIWVLPRKRALVPFTALAILIPLTQQILVVGVHLQLLRLLIACVWARVGYEVYFRNKQLMANGITTLDRLFLLWTLATVATYALLWGEVGALILRLGFLYNALGTYFLYRHFCNGRRDCERLIRTFAVVCAIVAVIMIVERQMGYSPLRSLGLATIPELRHGRIRPQGPFLHPIIAGTFGAILVPMFISLWWTGRSKAYAAVGLISGAIMIITAVASTALIGFTAGVAAVCFWPMRRHLRYVRWGVVAMLTALHMVMKAPVWALIMRIDLTGGSSKWHRFELVDNFIRRFGEWWLLGTRNSDGWGYEMWDSSNWYVETGIRGGLLSLLLFIGLIVAAFRCVGTSVRKNQPRDASVAHFSWSLGAAVFSGSVAFMGITLFDQSSIMWYALFAFVATLASAATPVRSITSVEHPPMAANWTRRDESTSLFTNHRG